MTAVLTNFQTLNNIRPLLKCLYIKKFVAHTVVTPDFFEFYGIGTSEFNHIHMYICTRHNSYGVLEIACVLLFETVLSTNS